MRQIVQRIHGGMDGGDITTVLRHAAHHVPNRVAGIGIGDADMPIKIPDRTVKIGDRPLKTGFFAWPMPLPCYECRFPSADIEDPQGKDRMRTSLQHNETVRALKRIAAAVA